MKKTITLFGIIALAVVIGISIAGCDNGTTDPGNGGDTTAPVLSAGSVNRTSDTAATIGFTTSEAGTAYYLVKEDNAAAPVSAEVKAGASLGAVSAGAVTGKAVTLTAGAKDIYVVVEDAAGNISSPLKIDAAAYNPGTEPCECEGDAGECDCVDCDCDPCNGGTTEPCECEGDEADCDCGTDCDCDPCNGGTTDPCAEGHDWNDWTVETPATCTTAGTRTRTCKRNSSHTETETDPAAPALGHDWGNWDITTPATCTTAGTRTRTCQRDGSHTETEPIPALGHDWGDWEITTPATCTTAGSRTRTCKRDGTHTETETITASHNWQNTAPVMLNVAASTAGALVYIPGEERCGICNTTQPATVPPGFDSIAGLRTYLTSLPNDGSINSNTPVAVRLVGVDMSTAANWTSLHGALPVTGARHVALDLSACTGDFPSAVEDFRGASTASGTFHATRQFIVSLVLPDTFTSIADGTNQDPTFKHYRALKMVSGAGVTGNIGYFAFGGSIVQNRLTTLESAHFPSATSIGNQAFYGTALTTADFPAVTTIGASAFNSCTALTTANFPSATSIGSVVTEGSGAFSGCTALTTVNFPLVETIGHNTFQNCAALTTATFPAATRIGIDAFRGTALTTANFPVATRIDSSAFRNCSMLTTVNFPLVTTIGSDAFNGCTVLATLELPAMTTFNRAAFNDSSVQTLTLPAVTTVANNAFQGLSALTTVNLPSATTIGNEAFFGCQALTTLDISSVTSIGMNAFASTGTTALTVTMGATAPRVGVMSFNGVNSAKTVTVHIPSNATGYGHGTYDNTDTTTNNWGNAFRGIGWREDFGYQGAPVNENITLGFETF